jgi:hypothetical protein
MQDVDWFNQDAVFRNQASASSTDLQDALAQLLYARNQGYQQIDNTRRDWTQSRNRAQTDTGEEYASRGLLSSGIYKQALDSMLAEYEKQSGQIGGQEQELAQQYGQRDSLAGGINPSQLVDGNYTALADIYGLLGQRGVQAGNAYNTDINQARAESAQRAGQSVVNTLGW